jgi:hypothetical protein
MTVKHAYIVACSAVHGSDLASCICASDRDRLCVVFGCQHGADIRNLADEIRLSRSEGIRVCRKCLQEVLVADSYTQNVVRAI